MGAPLVQHVTCARHELAGRYAACVAANPLLARVEGACRSDGWSAEEIRTMQLLVAVASNASLQARLTELELALGRPVRAGGAGTRIAGG